MKNLIPLFIIVIISLIAGLIFSLTGDNYSSNIYQKSSVVFKSEVQSKTLFIPNITTTPNKKKVGVEQQQTLNYSITPTYKMPTYTTTSLPNYQSNLGYEDYQKAWNNVVHISNPSPTTRYVTMTKSYNRYTGSVTISYW